MGDRANIYVRNDDDSGVYLYTHWGGTELPEILRQGLIRGQSRWTDAPYLTRILFCEMVRGRELEETGFGISACLGDGSYPLLVVDCETQTVTVRNDLLTSAVIAEFPFSAYVAKAKTRTQDGGVA